MQIVVTVWSSDSNRGLGFDYAVIRCNDPFLKQSLQRLHAFQAQQHVDPSLEESRYWDASAEYFNLWAGVASQPESVHLSAELARMMDGLAVDRREAVVTLDELEITDERIGAVECAMVIVRKEGIAFTALLKNDDVRLTTAEIPGTVLESALSALK